MQQEMFSRSERLLGVKGMERLRSLRAIVFGVGGVGSWVAEALVRTGVTHLTIVDSDNVAVSNINRQLPATTLTVGEPKVEALKRHLLEVNPEAEITALNTIYSAENAPMFELEKYGAVSEQTAMEMAKGVRERTGSDIGISATGIAGPGGGSKETPVGTVFLGISTKDGEDYRRLSLSSKRSREFIRMVSATNAYDMVIKWIKSKK